MIKSKSYIQKDQERMKLKSYIVIRLGRDEAKIIYWDRVTFKSQTGMRWDEI